MTATPALSPWPPPAPNDVVESSSSPPTASAKQARHTVAALLRTAKRLSSPSERAEHAAAKEEQRISDELDDLPAGWFVLHSPDLEVIEVSVDDETEARVDHVVVGPGGVFLIHLEHRAGSKVWVTEHKLTIDGTDSDRLCEARDAARRASDRLTAECGFAVAVQVVLVLIDAATMQTLSRPAEVHVRTQHDIRDWLCKQPARLDAEMVTTVHAYLGPAEMAQVSAPVYALGSSTTTGI